MPNLFYIIKHDSLMLSCIDDHLYVSELELARMFPNLDLAELFLKKHPNVNLKIFEVSIYEV